MLSSEFGNSIHRNHNRAGQVGADRSTENVTAAWRSIQETAPSGEVLMLRPSSMVRSLTIALVAFFALHAAANAQTPPQPAPARISIEIVSGGFIIGGTGGSGTLTLDGKRYPLNIGGLRAGLLIGLSKANLSGEVLNINSPSDINGTYGAAEAGVAIVGGAKVARLKNGKGVVLVLRGSQIGLEAAIDLSGLQLSLK